MRRTDILASTTSLPARVAKLADARDLKSRVPKGTCRFNSGPGHHPHRDSACSLFRDFSSQPDGNKSSFRVQNARRHRRGSPDVVLFCRTDTGSI